MDTTKAKKPLLFRLTGFSLYVGRVGQVWALVLFNKTALRVISKLDLLKNPQD
jgi:hypothetical protein